MLSDLTSRDAVLAAIEEFDRLGRDAFLTKHGFGRAYGYFVRHNGQLYDSKAIAGVAHGYQHPRLGTLTSGEFSGGEMTVQRQLESLGFEIVGPERGSDTAPDDLQPGQVYTWEELAGAFGFKPAYLSVAGGMPVSSAADAVLLITHPGGGKSFDYEDYWDGEYLVYTGRGKVGDQRREGANLDVAENRRALFVFEAAGPKQLLFLGRARCVEERQGRAPDDNGDMRTVLQFRLRFDSAGGRSAAPEPSSPRGDGRPAERRPRPFDPDAPPPAAPKALAQEPADPEQTAAKREKANRDHHAMLCELVRHLQAAGWKEIEEIPSAVDLQASGPGAERVIFEVKTVGATNELSQTRGGLAQLYEYRLEHGEPEDELCLVVNRPLSTRRQRLLGSLAVAVLICRSDGIAAGNDRGSRLADALGSSKPSDA